MVENQDAADVGREHLIARGIVPDNGRSPSVASAGSDPDPVFTKHGTQLTEPPTSDGSVSSVPASLEYEPLRDLAHRGRRAPWPTTDTPDVIAESVDHFATATNTPEMAAAVVVLGVAAAASAGLYVVHPFGNWREPVQLYLALVSAPGSGKSPLFNGAARALIGYQLEHESNDRQLLAKWSAEVDAAKAKKRKLTEAKNQDGKAIVRAGVALAELQADKPMDSRRFTSDATTEAIAQLMADHGGPFAWVSSEPNLFDILAGVYSSGRVNLDAFLQAWSSDPISVDRRGGAPLHIRRPALSVCIGAQPAAIGALYGDKQLQGRGVADRFLYAAPDFNIGYRDVSPRPEADPPPGWGQAIRWLASRPRGPEPHTLELDADAQDRLQEWRGYLEESRRPHGDLAGLGSWVEKQAGNTLRIAGLYAAVEHAGAANPGPVPGPVTDRHLAQAIAAEKVFVQHMAAVSVGDPMVTRARGLVGWLVDHDADTHPVSVRDLHRKTDGRASADDIGAALDLLVDHGWVATYTTESGEKGGRPSRLVVLNPDARQALRPDGRSVA